MTARDEAIENEAIEIFDDIEAELIIADRYQAAFASLHEAYAVILEEVDELWEIVRLKRKNRSPIEVRNELIQIAAMAIKAILSMDNFTGGEV